MDFEATHRLGKRAFLLFLNKRLKLAVALLVIAVSLWFTRDKFSPDYVYLVDLAVWWLLVLFAAVLTARILQTVFEYLSYAYRFDEESFRVIRGYFTRQEMGVAYHQIQNVSIRRTLTDRSFRVSQLILVMVGHHDQTQNQIVLPGIDRNKAKIIQKELLHRARKHFYERSEGGEVSKPQV